MPQITTLRNIKSHISKWRKTFYHCTRCWFGMLILAAIKSRNGITFHFRWKGNWFSERFQSLTEWNKGTRFSSSTHHFYFELFWGMWIWVGRRLCVREFNKTQYVEWHSVPRSQIHVSALSHASLVLHFGGCWLLLSWSCEVFRAAPTETRNHVKDIKLQRTKKKKKSLTPHYGIMHFSSHSQNGTELLFSIII